MDHETIHEISLCIRLIIVDRYFSIYVNITV